MYDLVIRQGLVVDGTGAVPFVADVAVTAGKIVEVGEVSGPAKKSIDADGRIVAPGFIDIHTHLDAQPFGDLARATGQIGRLGTPRRLHRTRQ